MAGKACAGPARVPSSPDRRRQCRCTFEGFADTPRGDAAGYGWAAGSGYVAANLLCRVRWAAAQARYCETYGSGLAAAWAVAVGAGMAAVMAAGLVSGTWTDGV